MRTLGHLETKLRSKARHGGIQVNFCKSQVCINFGVTISEKPKANSGAPNPYCLSCVVSSTPSGYISVIPLEFPQELVGIVVRACGDFPEYPFSPKTYGDSQWQFRLFSVSLPSDGLRRFRPETCCKAQPAWCLGLAKETVSFEEIIYFKRDEHS